MSEKPDDKILGLFASRKAILTILSSQFDGLVKDKTNYNLPIELTQEINLKMRKIKLLTS
ncbi:MAG: hypothetical protein DRN92_05310 [Thermoproteota archaeon]|nr:MAG: hypothetical protein DRN92_05310 [Candidatus Korarchaeota archaeon]